jgi:CheY-like chemotaxis protein
VTELSGWVVLLVDDEMDSLNLIADVLTHHGAKVISAESGQACLDLLGQVSPTVIILDLNMPKPDGWELLAHIRKMDAFAHVPVIAMTAYHTVNVQQEALGAGFNAYAPKPIKSQEILDIVKAAVG